MIKLSALNFARRFIGDLDRESLFCEFCSQEAQNRQANRPARALIYK